MKRFIEAMAVEELDEEEPAPGAAEGEGGGAAGGSEAVEEFTRVERVLAEAAQGEGLPPAYLVKWRGLPYSACTWECTRHLLQAQSEIGRFRACFRARRQPACVPQAGLAEHLDQTVGCDRTPKLHQLLELLSGH